MGPINRKDAAAAGRQWDAYVLGWPLSDVESDFSATIAQIHAEDDVPHVDSAFADRLGARLMPSYGAGIRANNEAHRRIGGAEVNESVSVQGNSDSFENHGSRSSQTIPPQPTSRFRKGWFETASLFVIVVLMIGALYRGIQGGYFDSGPGIGSHPTSTPNPYADSATAPAMYRGNAAHTGSNGFSYFNQPVLKWKKKYDTIGMNVSPVYAHDRLYFAQNHSGEMVAVNAYTGEKVWSAHVGSSSSMPAIGYGKVYLSTSDTGDGGALVALDEGTGVEQWRVPSEDSQGGSPVIDGGLVFVQSNISKNGALYAFDVQTGEERWTAKVSPEGTTDDDYFQSSTAAPSVRNGVVYAASGYGDLVAYTAAKGEVLWRFHVSQATYGTPVIFENTVFVSSFEVIGPPDTLERPPTQGNLYAVDTATGQERWSLPISSSDAQPAISDGVLYITGMDVAGDSIYALNAVNGDTIWRLREPDHHFTNVVAGGEVIYASTYEGKVFALNSRDGSVLWQVDTRKAVLGDPIGTNDSVVVSSADGAIFALGQDLSLATPVPPTSVIDVSGLPECQPYRTLPTIEMTGTPALTLIPGRWEEFQDTILVSEIPQDTSASEEAKAGIRETLARMEACENQLTSEPRGFFTDDFLRRPSAIWNPNSARYFGAHAVYADGGGPALRFDDAWTLPDGRVGIAIRYDFGENSYQRYGHGTFVIFTEQDGHWLIDESYRIVPELSNQG